MAQRRGSRARQAWLALVLAATASLEAVPPEVRAQARRSSTAGSSATSAPAPAADGIQLRVRRLPDAVELVLVDAGLGASLTQQPLGNQWLGELRTDRARSLKVGPQSVALAADGMERISFEGSGTSFRLTVTAAAGRNLPQPVVSSDGRDLMVRFPAAPNVLSQTASPNLRQPTPVPVPANVPPLRPRAVAPPVGDMSVGTMTLRNRGLIQLKGPSVTLTTRRANARDVLLVLAQMGGYGFVFQEEEDKIIAKATSSFQSGVGVSNDQTQTERSTGEPRKILPVTVNFKNEPFSQAFNYVLMATGLQARMDKGSNIIVAGPNALSRSLNVQVSKVYRLNQVSANSAADYLANLGAKVTKTNTVTSVSTTGIPESQQVSGSTVAQTSQESQSTFVEAYGASSGPLIGLNATTDSRLGSITLVGEGEVVTIAEQYLRQLDLRQRQVALSLQILDVNLDNASEIDNSFAFRFGNNFIINDKGTLLAAFGRNLPPTEIQAAQLAGGASSAKSEYIGKDETNQSRPPLDAAPVNPGIAYSDGFYDFLKAQIVSTSTKVIASPTLILQDNPGFLRESQGGSQSSGGSGDGSLQQGIRPIGIDSPIGRRRANEGVITVGTNVVTDYSTQTTQGAIVCTPKLSPAGLVLGARIEKIDDNGFVTFSLSPSISAITGTEDPPIGCGSRLNILSVRSLDTGALRVRDGQTLVMTGVISDFDRTEVSKWPILGDLPLVGQFFRASGRRREKRELVILATPRIIDDEQGGTYGYGYIPSTNDARQLFYGSSKR